MQCPKCEAEIPPKRKTCPRYKARLHSTKPTAAATSDPAGAVRHAATRNGAVADLAAENARLARELAEALQQQTASSEILRVISRSPTDTQPMFSAIARNVVGLCNAMFGAVFSFDERLVHFVAGHQVTDDALGFWRATRRHPGLPQGRELNGQGRAP
jgi:hypothetical protein